MAVIQLQQMDMFTLQDSYNESPMHYLSMLKGKLENIQRGLFKKTSVLEAQVKEIQMTIDFLESEIEDAIKLELARP